MTDHTAVSLVFWSCFYAQWFSRFFHKFLFASLFIIANDLFLVLLDRWCTAALWHYGNNTGEFATWCSCCKGYNWIHADSCSNNFLSIGAITFSTGEMHSVTIQYFVNWRLMFVFDGLFTSYVPLVTGSSCFCILVLSFPWMSLLQIKPDSLVIFVCLQFQKLRECYMPSLRSMGTLFWVGFNKWSYLAFLQANVHLYTSICTVYLSIFGLNGWLSYKMKLINSH